MNNKDSVVVFVTAGSREEGEKIAGKIIEERLAACCNLVGPVTSFFWWDDKVERNEEMLLIIKTSSETFEKLKNRVRELHSYSVPEIIALPVTAGLEEYLTWIYDETVLKKSLIPGP